MNAKLLKSARQSASEQVTVLGGVANIVLSLIKVLAGYLGHSHALVADGVHSLADLIADGAVLLATRYGSQAADHDHPYGHQRIETVTAVFIAIFLLLTGVSIITTTVSQFFQHNHAHKMEWIVLWISLFSCLVNEIIYHYTMWVARKYQSPLLKAHASHRRSDAGSSLVVSVGILGSLCGFYYLDYIAAIIMGLFILKMAYTMGRQGLEELIDQGLDDSTLDAITLCIQEIDGVEAMHQLRTRFMAGKIFADVHIIVNPRISVSEGHYIGDQVYRTLKRQFPNITDIIVHVDAEDDEIIPRSNDLPSRQQLCALLHEAWLDLPGYEKMQWLTVHYLNQQLELNITLPLLLLNHYSATQLSQQYQETLVTVYPYCTVTIYFYEV